MSSKIMHYFFLKKARRTENSWLKSKIGKKVIPLQMKFKPMHCKNTYKHRNESHKKLQYMSINWQITNYPQYLQFKLTSQNHVFILFIPAYSLRKRRSVWLINWSFIDTIFCTIIHVIAFRLNRIRFSLLPHKVN